MQPQLDNPVPRQASSTQKGAAAQRPQIQSEQELEYLRQELDKARRMASIGELTSTTTHEFNNLLMTILNYAKMGLRHKDDATRDKALQRIFDSANRASKITNTVLAMARNRGSQKEPTCLKSLVEDTMLLLEREFRKFRIQVELDLQQTTELPLFANDIQRVLVNLLINARQATPEGGFVRVSLSQTQDDVVLTVRDNGKGIPADTLPKIFDPYFTTKSGPDSTGRGGTGIGLSSCKEIIDAHGGKIRVESSVGKGTAFILRFQKAGSGTARLAS